MYQILAEVEDHLNITIQQIENNMKVPTNDFDGKVTYGEKQVRKGTYIINTQITLVKTTRTLRNLT